MDRPSGYYWVLSSAEWEPARWDGKHWLLIGEDFWVSDRDLHVGPRIPEPDEPSESAEQEHRV